MHIEAVTVKQQKLLSGSNHFNREVIDYHFVNQELMDRVKGAAIHMDVLGSDHCPISVELKA